MPRSLLLVIDSLGVGAMEDVGEVRPADLGANTLAHVLEANPDLQLPALERMGLGRVLHPRQEGNPVRGSWGVNRLQHQGADSYLGHQELMGSKPLTPLLQGFAEVSAQVREALEAQHHRWKLWVQSGKYLVVASLNP